MMRLTLGLGMVVAMSAAAATAHADPYGMAGCGLGSMVFGKEDTKLKQILAATTNGIVGNQTFGISSGTLNCVEAGMVKAAREQAAFAEVNFQDLKRNMAAGGGEFLTSFATLLGCEDKAKPALAKMTQERYERIYASNTTTPVQMLSSLKSEIKATPALANACSDERALARSEGRPMTLAQK